MKIQRTLNLNLLTALFITGILFSAPVKASAESPGEVVVNTIDKGVQILKDPAFQDPKLYPERRARLWELLAPVFDFQEISKRVLGQYWSKLTPEEQTNFIKIFTEIVKDSYLGETDSYSGEKIVYVREIIQGNRGKVQTNFFTVDGKKFVVDFSLQKNDEHWKVYDATVEGVSVVNTYRGQFYDILAKSPFGALMTKLEDKHNSFIQSKGNSDEKS